MQDEKDENIQLTKLKIFSSPRQYLDNDNYVLVLCTEDETIKIPLIVHQADAFYLNVVIEKIPCLEQIMHFYFIAFLNATNFSLDRVVITEFKEGIFKAVLMLTNPWGRHNTIEGIEMSIKPSDAIILALIDDKSMYIYTSIINELNLKITIPVVDINEKKNRNQ